jgi:hypothetical protein
MARRRRFFGGRKVTVPKIIKLKAPKLDIRDLASAYEWLTADRALGFRLAFDWYGANLTALLYGDPMDADRQRQYDKATKAKSLGDSSNIEFEKIQAWTTALHVYERVWAKRNLPKVDAALDTAVPNRRMAQIVAVLANLNAAFEGHGVRFRVSLGTDREFGNGEILVPQTELAAMVAQAPIKAALAEAVTVAKVTSVVTNADGNAELDGVLFMTNLTAILAGIHEWAAKIPHNGFRTSGKVTGMTGATKAPRVVSKPRSVIRGSFEVFLKGSKKSLIATRLSDGQYHTIESLKKLCEELKTGHNQIKFTLAELVSRGGFTVEYRADGSEVSVKV